MTVTKNRYYKHSRISETRFRQILRYFASDMTATDAAKLSGISVRSINSIFLKKNHRIEVLGLVLLISLLIWRLMEYCMRRFIADTAGTITGWKNKPTSRPTSFMMTTKFLSILVLRVEHQRQLARPLNTVQLEYLKALNVDPEAFVSP